MPIASGGGGGGPIAPPAPGPAPGASPIPLQDGDYASAAALANAAYGHALAQINNQRQTALQQFGYAGTIDPTTGTITNMHFDPNNPYGQFQDMLRSHALDQAQAQNADLARGLGTFSGPRGGGLAAQALTADKQSFGADSANLGQSLMSTLSDLQGQQQDAQDTNNNALWNAELASAQNAISNQDFNPADFSGITDKGPAGSDYVPAKTPTMGGGKATAKSGKPNTFKTAASKPRRTRRPERPIRRPH